MTARSPTTPTETISTSDLILRTADLCHAERQDVREVIHTFLNLVTEELCHGKQVRLRHIGKLYLIGGLKQKRLPGTGLVWVHEVRLNIKASKKIKKDLTLMGEGSTCSAHCSDSNKTSTASH